MSTGCAQIGSWAIEERVPELSLPHYHTDDYLDYHHRIFVWRLIEILIRDRDPYQSKGLISQGPVEGQKKGEDDQESQDREGLVQSLRSVPDLMGADPIRSPNPAGPGLNEHVIKPDSLNVTASGG